MDLVRSQANTFGFREAGPSCMGLMTSNLFPQLGNLFTNSSHGIPPFPVNWCDLQNKTFFFCFSCGIVYSEERKETHLSAWPCSWSLSLKPPSASSKAELLRELQGDGIGAYCLESSLAVKDLGVLVYKKIEHEWVFAEIKAVWILGYITTDFRLIGITAIPSPPYDLVFFLRKFRYDYKYSPSRVVAKTSAEQQERITFKSIFLSTVCLDGRCQGDSLSSSILNSNTLFFSEHHSLRGKFWSSAALHAFILQKEVPATGGVLF